MISIEQYGLTLDKLDKTYDSNIYTQARLFRTNTAREEITKTPNTNTLAISGMLSSVLERAPFENTEYVLGFNTYITLKSCEAILLSDINIIEKIAIYSAIIELGAKEFINPTNIDEITIHLGAAKSNGFFFTPPSVAIRMVLAALSYNKSATSIFDPSCGSGLFLAYQILFNENAKTIVGVEIDSFTAQMAKKLLEYIVTELSLETDITIHCLDFFDYYNEYNNKKYDLIVMNPPYGSLKFLSSDLTDQTTKANLSLDELNILKKRLRKQMLEYTARLRKQFLSYGTEKGTLEYSKLFLAACHKLLNPNGFVVAITPSSWLGDESSTSFRKHILLHGYVHELWLFPEKAKLFQGVNQPTVVSIIGSSVTDNIKLTGPITKISELYSSYSTLDISSIELVSGEKCKLPKCNATSLEILVKLQKKGRFIDIQDVTNSRGELDLTEYKEFTTNANTGHRLIRGDHIEGFNLSSVESSDKNGYVLYDDFCEKIKTSSKYRDIAKERIAIAQCSYLQKSKRIEAALVPANSIIGNSCNYICVDDNHLKLLYYWIWINSFICEWAFRIFSYNNHVGNKEIDELPCIPFACLSEDLLNVLHNLDLSNTFNLTLSINSFIAHTFKLSLKDYKTILNDLNINNIDVFIQNYKRGITNNEKS